MYFCIIFIHFWASCTVHSFLLGTQGSQRILVAVNYTEAVYYLKISSGISSCKTGACFLGELLVSFHLPLCTPEDYLAATEK